MKIYIAGPMTGLPDLNRSAFERAKQALDAEGHNAVNPHDLHPTDVQWHTAMRTDIMELLTCDAVALLDNWQNSRGALLEHFIASTLGVPCKPLSDYVAEAYR